MKTQNIILLLATLLTGLLAGVFFTWTNAITPGIGRLSDIGYLQTFQHMNRAILNLVFFIVFLGPLLFTPIAAAFYSKSKPKYIFWLLIGTTVIYGLGVFIVTLLGNLPLNDMLDNTNLENISLEDAKGLRNSFEDKWNNLHLIRTITSSTSLILLILTCLLKKDDVRTSINN